MAKKVTCIFCSETRERGIEHAIPKWLQIDTGLIDEKIKGVLYSSKLGYLPIDIRDQLGGSFKAGTVCENCNNGWMNDLENSFRPIFRKMANNTKRQLSSHEQDIVSLWCFKTALMINKATNTNMRIPDVHYEYLYKYLKIPQNVFIHVARLSHDDNDIIFEMQNMALVIKHDKGQRLEDVMPLIMKKYNTYISFNHIIFRVVYFNSDKTKFESRKRYATKQIFPVKYNRVKIPTQTYDSMEDFATDLVINIM